MCTFSEVSSPKDEVLDVEWFGRPPQVLSVDVLPSRLGVGEWTVVSSGVQGGSRGKGTLVVVKYPIEHVKYPESLHLIGRTPVCRPLFWVVPGPKDRGLSWSIVHKELIEVVKDDGGPSRSPYPLKGVDSRLGCTSVSYYSFPNLHPPRSHKILYPTVVPLPLCYVCPPTCLPGTRSDVPSSTTLPRTCLTVQN